MVATTGCAAVMIGRGALGAPWIFSPASCRARSGRGSFAGTAR